MNASFRKVLRKVLSDFIITEPYVRRSRVRRRRCPRTKRVMGRSGFAFRCHNADYFKREREREREKQKNTTNIKIKEYKELKVRMHENA